MQIMILNRGPKTRPAAAPKSMPVHVLHITSKPTERERLRCILDHTKWALSQARNFEEARVLLESEPPVTVVICERISLSSHHWKDLFDEIMTRPTPPAFLVSSSEDDRASWMEALKLGAEDVLPTPFEASDVYETISLVHTTAVARRLARSRLVGAA